MYHQEFLAMNQKVRCGLVLLVYGYFCDRRKGYESFHPLALADIEQLPQRYPEKNQVTNFLEVVA